jgi:hypothetical protein
MARTVTLTTLLAATPLLLAACAAGPGTHQEGTVSAVFVEPLPGILLSPELTEPDDALPQWVEVQLNSRAAVVTRTLARIEARDGIGIGDRVRLQPGTARPGIEIPVPGVPGLRAVRTGSTGSRPAMVASIQSRSVRIEVMPP